MRYQFINEVPASSLNACCLLHLSKIFHRTRMCIKDRGSSKQSLQYCAVATYPVYPVSQYTPMLGTTTPSLKGPRTRELILHVVESSFGSTVEGNEPFEEAAYTIFTLDMVRHAGVGQLSSVGKLQCNYKAACRRDSRPASFTRIRNR